MIISSRRHLCLLFFSQNDLLKKKTTGEVIPTLSKVINQEATQLIINSSL